MSIGVVAMGRTRPCAPSNRPTQSRPSTGSSRSCHRPEISRFPSACPLRGPVVSRRSCMTSRQVRPHSDSSQDRHLFAQSPGGSAVVGDGDDGREGVGDVAQGPQGGRQSVSATEGDNGLAGFSSLNPASSIKIGHYSLPMSRCMTRTECPLSRRRAAMASEHATERCFPPVQPMAIVTNGFNSAR